jgi:hypothetical protein
MMIYPRLCHAPRISLFSILRPFGTVLSAGWATISLTCFHVTNDIDGDVDIEAMATFAFFCAFLRTSSAPVM